MECEDVVGVLDRVNTDDIFEVRFGPQRERTMAVLRVVREEERTRLRVEGGERERGRGGGGGGRGEDMGW